MNKILKILIVLNDLDEKLKIFKDEKYREIFNISSKMISTWEKKRENEFKKLPPEVQENYERLRKRYGFGLASVTEGSCNNCNQKLPVFMFAIKNPNKELRTCPNCGIYIIL
ncbi:MAG: hypothetical protein ABIM49_06120 [candidate division WOR-3 bacterium]